MRYSTLIGALFASVLGATAWANSQGGPSAVAATASASPADQDTFLKQAARGRLLAEREQVAAEIRAEILYDAAKVEQAIKIINDKPADTQADNIARFLAAFAMVETKFQWPYELYQEALHLTDRDEAAAMFDKAAQGVNLVLNSDDRTNLAAAEHYLYAAALQRAGKHIPAVEAFNKLAVDMPQRISFAAASTMDAARLYETLERNIYAMDMYTYCLANYGLTLEPAQAKQIADRLAELKALYDDPMATLAGGMDQVRDRLANLDTGKYTQDREKQIAMILRDIIQTAEEQQSSNPPPPDPNARPSPAGNPTDEPAISPAPGNRPGPPAKRPSTPASTGLLPPGVTMRPAVAGRVYDPTMAGNRMDKFPPREQERLHALVVKVMSERYRDIISQYTLRITNQR